MKPWQDLTAPAFKDNVTIPDTALSGAALVLLIGLQNGEGEKVWTLFDQLKANGMMISGPNAQAVTPVLQGAKAAVFGAVDYVTYNNIAQGEAVKVIFLENGTVVAPRSMMILKSSHCPGQCVMSAARCVNFHRRWNRRPACMAHPVYRLCA